MRFNNIITEAIIDSADIPKSTKNILKYINNEYANDWDMGIDRGNFIKISIDLSKKFAISISDAIKAIEFYDKYKDIFFREDMIQDFIPEITPDNREAFLYAVHEYLWKNYESKQIYDFGRITADLYFMETPINTYHDDMLGMINAAITVNFSDIPEYTELEFGSSWECQLHMNFSVFERDKVGYDIIDMEEIAAYTEKNSKKYINNEIVGTGWIKSDYFNPPKYFDKGEIEKFGDRVVEIIKKIIRKHHHDLEGFGDWLQHGGNVFENHKKR